MANLTIKDWLTVAQLLVLLISVAINLWLFVTTRRDARWKAMGEAINAGDHELGERLDNELSDVQTKLHRIDCDVIESGSGLDKRLTVLERQVESLPTHTDLTEIRAGLSRIGHSVAALDERSQSTLGAVRRIEQYLLESKR